jgi:hypothetical protein
MYISTNNLLYLIGAISSILAVFFSRSNIPSFFSRNRIIRLLKFENQDLDKALKKLHKPHFYYYDAFIFFSLVIIFLILGIFGLIHFTQDVFHMIMVIVSSIFLVFYLFTISKLASLYHKNEDKITDSLTKIIEWIELVETLLVSTLIMDVFMSAVSLSPNNTVEENQLQLIAILVIGIIVITYMLFIKKLTIRGIERNYMLRLIEEKKLPSLLVKIKVKGRENTIIGNIVLLDISNILIEEMDGYKMSLEYNKIETISSKSIQNNKCTGKA